MKILKISQKNLEKTAKIATKAIQEGKVLICPTDTVYGLIADAGNKKAVERIFKIKKRPKQKPLPIFVKDLKMAEKLAKISKEQKKILKKHWPGKYTFVLKFQNPNTKFQINSKSQILKKHWPGKFTFVLIRKKGTKIYGIDEETIALRAPKYRFLDNLLKKVNKPLAQTSANVSGKPASGEIKEILAQLKERNDQPDLVISAGNLPKSKSSKVIDLTRKISKILRY